VAGVVGDTPRRRIEDDDDDEDEDESKLCVCNAPVVAKAGAFAYDGLN
jgi:hypothetical protein